MIQYFNEAKFRTNFCIYFDLNFSSTDKEKRDSNLSTKIDTRNHWKKLPKNSHIVWVEHKSDWSSMYVVKKNNLGDCENITYRVTIDKEFVNGFMSAGLLLSL